VEYALSLVLGPPYVHANQVTYGDCEEYQLQCIGCHEPVFLGIRQSTGRHYFSHHRRREGRTCEWRVHQLVRQAMDTKPAYPQGQTLLRYLQRFERVMLDTEEAERLFGADIERMRARPFFRQLVKDAFVYLEDMADHSMQQFRRDRPDEADTLQAVLDFLLTPHAFRVRVFAICFAIIVQAETYRTVTSPGDDGLQRIRYVYINAPDNALRRVVQAALAADGPIADLQSHRITGAMAGNRPTYRGFMMALGNGLAVGAQLFLHCISVSQATPAVLPNKSKP